jgi:hypothetical protein
MGDGEREYEYEEGTGKRRWAEHDGKTQRPEGGVSRAEGGRVEATAHGRDATRPRQARFHFLFGDDFLRSYFDHLFFLHSLGPSFLSWNPTSSVIQAGADYHFHRVE